MNYKYEDMSVLTHKPTTCKVALWLGDNMEQSQRFSRIHNMPTFPVGLAGGRRGLIIPSRDLAGRTVDVAVASGEYLAVFEDASGTWMRPMTQEQLDMYYDFADDPAE